mgnify:CR=1 FL=1
MKTIVAVSTAPMTSAIGIVRISGEKAFEISEKIFSKPLAGVGGYRVVYGKIYDGDKILDTALATVFHAPNSYTGENTVELSCHGSPYILNRVAELLVENGAVRAGRGEFSKMAYINGKMDAIQAEGVIDLIEAQTAAEVAAAQSELGGKISEKVEEVRKKLVSLSADILAYVDYPDEDIADVSPEKTEKTISECYEEINSLALTYGRGRMIKNGVRTVICGKPNAGKSMLMNSILGCERSIVTETEGTTRDVVGESVVFGGVKLEVRDTAGIREAVDTVEKIGVRLAEKELARADLILFVFDMSREKDENDERVLEEIKKSNAKKIAVLNKSDIAEKSLEFEGFDASVTVSAKTGEGMKGLEKAVAAAVSEGVAPGEVVMNARQFECLCGCAAALKNALDNIAMTPDVLLDDVNEAIFCLSSVTGKGVSEQIIEDIFSRFCVGK